MRHFFVWFVLFCFGMILLRRIVSSFHITLFRVCRHIRIWARATGELTYLKGKSPKIAIYRCPALFFCVNFAFLFQLKVAAGFGTCSFKWRNFANAAQTEFFLTFFSSIFYCFLSASIYAPKKEFTCLMKFFSLASRVSECPCPWDSFPLLVLVISMFVVGLRIFGFWCDFIHSITAIRIFNYLVFFCHLFAFFFCTTKAILFSVECSLFQM